MATVPPAAEADALVRRADAHIAALLSNVSLILSAASVAQLQNQQQNQSSSSTAPSSVSTNSSAATRLSCSHSMLVAETAASNIFAAADSLLAITANLKQTLVIHDFAALNAQVLARNRTLSRRTETTKTALADMHKDLMDVQHQLETALGSAWT